MKHRRLNPLLPTLTAAMAAVSLSVTAEPERVPLSALVPRDIIGALVVEDGRKVIARVEDNLAQPGPVGDHWHALVEALEAEIEETLPAERLAEFDVDGKPATAKALLDLFGGDALIAFPAIDDAREVILLERFDGDLETYRAIQLRDRDGYEASELEVEAVDLGEATYYRERLPDAEDDSYTEYWALLGDVAVETTSAELIEEVIEAHAAWLDGDGGDSLAMDRRYLDARELAGGGQLHGYFNFPLFYELMLAQRDPEDDIPTNPLQITVESLIDGLKLGRVGAVCASVDLLSEPVKLRVALAHGSRDAGLLSLFTYVPQTDPQWPGFIVPEATEATVSYIDLAALVDATLALMNQISPNFGAFYQLQFDNFRAQSGIDIDSALLGNLGQNLVTFSRPRVDIEGSDNPDASEATSVPDENVVVAVAIRDRQAFENAVIGLIDLISGGNRLLETEDFADVTIYQPRPVDGTPPPVAFAFTTDYLFFVYGSVDTLKESLLRLQQDAVAPAHLEALLKRAQPEVIDLSYIHVGPLVDQLAEAFDVDESGLGSATLRLLRHFKDYAIFANTSVSPTFMRSTAEILPREASR